MRRLYGILLLFYTQILSATEYIYPVAAFGDGKSILYIHQHGPTKIELFEWNTEINHAEQILWSVFNPAGLTMLPNNSGFSFIDNGRLRIKLFQRRSPKAIDFDEPIYNIDSLHWIDDHSCYCSAQYNDNFGLFQLHDDGTMKCLAAENGKDYMYPQKIGDQLFYIERSAPINGLGVSHYTIMILAYPNNDSSLMPAELIVNFHDTPIVFLTMISHQEGFVLEHTRNRDSDSTTMQFSYHRIIKEGNIWCKNLLFSFVIPTYLLLHGEQGLYESILPLLPRIVGNKIYFVNCTKKNKFNLEPYFYDLMTTITQKITVPAKKGHYFVPIQCKNKFYFGGTKLQNEKAPFFVF